MKDDFNFMTNSKDKKAKKEKKETATSGSPNAITPEIRAAAKKLAESSTGLDIAAFQRKHHIYVMNVAELLEDK